MTNRRPKLKGDPPDRVKLPAWAQDIEVEQQSEVLMVKGKSRLIQPRIVSHINERRQMSVRGTDSPHVEFAAADNDAKLVPFIRNYGPVWGKVRQVEAVDDRSEDLTVEQSMEDLRRDQLEFSLLFHLARNLEGIRKKNDATLLENTWLAFLLLSPGETQLFCDEQGSIQLSLGGQILAIAESTTSINEAVRTAPTLFTDVMVRRISERFSLVRTIENGKLIDIPQHRREGILPSLLFLLRREFITRRLRLAICANENCRHPFMKLRKDHRYCNPECAKLQTQRNYWHHKGAERRRQRNANPHT